jgi:hypothetical protein
VPLGGTHIAGVARPLHLREYGTYAIDQALENVRHRRPSASESATDRVCRLWAVSSGSLGNILIGHVGRCRSTGHRF